jgi:hypothetical protein
MDNIRMVLGETGWGGVDWINLAQNRDKWRALMSGFTTGGLSSSAQLLTVSYRKLRLSCHMSLFYLILSLSQAGIFFKKRFIENRTHGIGAVDI